MKDKLGEGVNTVFRDVIFNTLIGFAIIVVLILPFINPAKKQADETKSAGSLIVEISWPSGWDTDVDLWIKAPGQKPIGYSNKNSPLFDLLRDDLGRINDPLDANYEFAYSREIVPGRYIINLHLYKNTENKFPVPVTVKVTKITKDRKSEVLLQTTVELLKLGQERTVWSFVIDSDKNIDPFSINSVFVPLRSNV